MGDEVPQRLDPGFAPPFESEVRLIASPLGDGWVPDLSRRLELVTSSHTTRGLFVRSFQSAVLALGEGDADVLERCRRCGRSTTRTWTPSNTPPGCSSRC
ncbi:hypothetical protein ACN28S_48590 [Cystobacter fuscus]